MSMPAVSYSERSAAMTRLSDLATLSKPRIALLSLATVAVGAVVAAWGMPNVVVLAHTLLATCLLAASASALNQYLERWTDAAMPRTADRPLPAGRLRPQDVLIGGLATGVVGLVYLLLAVGGATAFWGAVAWALYVWVYTPLKSRTTLNTVVGAIAGAAPVLIGYSAAGGQVPLEAATLFLVVYLWQFPHFMAIAWLYRDDYRSAGLRMLPAIEPDGRTSGMQSLVSAAALLLITLVPWLWAWGGTVYVAGAAVLGLAYLAASAAYCRRRDARTARRLLRVSLVYLPAWLGLLVATRFL